MSEENTLLPWKTSNDLRERFEVGDCDGQAIIARVDPCEDLPPEQREAITSLIVLACNAYDQDQKTIKALVAACEKVIETLDMSLYDGSNDSWAQGLIDVANAALALAKKE